MLANGREVFKVDRKMEIVTTMFIGRTPSIQGDCAIQSKASERLLNGRRGGSCDMIKSY